MTTIFFYPQSLLHVQLEETPMKNQLHSQSWVSQQTKIIPTETETPVPIILPILIYLGYGLLSLCIPTLNLNSPLSCCTSSGARSGAQGSRVATRRAYIGNKSSLQWNQTFKILALDKDFLLYTWQNIGQWRKSLNTHALPTLFLEQQEWLYRVFFCFPLCCMFAWILLLPTNKKITSCMFIFNLVA